MTNTLSALASHITASGIPIKTVAVYGGELKNAVKLRTQIPAVFLFPVEFRKEVKGNPNAVDLLVVTESASLDKSETFADNITLASALLDYLDSNITIILPDSNSAWQISRADLSATTLLIEDRFTIILLHLKLELLY